MRVTNCDRQAFVFVVEELEPFEGWGEVPSAFNYRRWHGTRLCPNPAMCRKATGRRMSTKFRNDMDDPERHEKRCGLCRQVGHSRKGCPNQPTGDVTYKTTVVIAGGDHGSGACVRCHMAEAELGVEVEKVEYLCPGLPYPSASEDDTARAIRTVDLWHTGVTKAESGNVELPVGSPETGTGSGTYYSRERRCRILATWPKTRPV
ncbi:hypothetical protein Ahy_A04g020942 [Arachis hypogaea]|uniref:Uncharacterized protein n=1 Tax=Arachis hypogaea TaxID=3818 RepID=A0A445DJ04_ARAHY|nr:hypothetical protein Ahy_A04g020942 [Arachis hypogaea]